MPRAITWTLGITVILYIALALAAVLTVPPAELGTSKAPLSLVFQRATGGSSAPITAIALFAIVNLALWRLKRREPGPSHLWKVPVWMPVAGFFVSLGFVLYGLARLAGAPA